MTNPGSVLGVRVDLLGRLAVQDRITQALYGDRLLHVLTLNPEQIMAALRDEEFGQLIANADLVTIDGVGVALALKLQGVAGVERVTGVGLMEEIASGGIPVYLLGGRTGSAEIAARNLSTREPAANVVGAWSGGSSHAFDDGQSLRRINESGARVVLVAFGAPAQVAWIERNRTELERNGVRVAIGVGGALDYAAGVVKPVPGWASSLGLEWFVRLIREPWRWRRQQVLPKFALLAGTEAIRLRWSRK